MSDTSSLTDLSEDEDVEMQEPPPISAQKAYDYLVPLIQKFDATMEDIALPKDLRGDWKKETESLRAKAVQRPYKVAIVGRTGVGKSTLLNALLHNQVLTASASGACTAVTTEISYKDVDTIEAAVEFIPPDEWRKALCHLVQDVTDTTVDTEEGPADNSNISLAHQARKRVIGVYPHLETVPERNWSVDELINEPLVEKYLGTTSVFSANRSSNFQKELEQFLASTLTSSETRALWPLVKIVKIQGRFKVLSTGVTLVDLPGYGDVDNVRDSIAEEYLKSADAICLVTGIARAKDDREIHQNLHKHLNQIILDGRVKEKSIFLVLTGADNPIASNEITLSRDQQVIVESSEKEAIKLGQKIKELQKRKEKKETSNGKNKAQHLEKLVAEITEKRALKETLIKRKNRLLARGRSELVTKALQDTYTQLYCEMAQIKDRTSVPSIPIFCLGSRDFLCTAEIVSDPPAIFLDPEETGIPKLRRYLEDDGERRNLTDAIVTMTSFYEFLSRTSQCSSSPAAHAAADVLEIYNTISGVEAAYKNRLEDLLVDVKQEYASLLAVVKAALDEAERQSPRIFKDKEKFKWNQYRAMMRQYGQYENGNLNADLTNEILPAIQQSWYKAVNTSIPLEIKVFCDDLRKELNKMVENICLQPGRHSSSSLRKSLGIESFIDDLSRMDLDCTKSTQRQGSRSWEPLMKGMLDDQYNKVSAERGPGMYKRMKSANQRYIEDNASNLYGKLYKTTEKLFSDTVNNINECNREEFSRFTKTMRQFLLGADVNITPELAARGEAEKVVKKFYEEHEDAACMLLDELKKRSQAIALPTQ